MRVLVTGATGFVGAAVCRALAARGHGVLALVRDPAKGRWLEQLGAELAVGDMWRTETYANLPARADAVVHAAQDKAPGRWTGRAVRRMHDSDALMTRTLADGCQKHGKVFVYTSGALCYAGAGSVIDETAPPHPVRLAAGHAAMVAELRRRHREDGLRARVVTPGFVYGPGGLLASMVESLRRGRLRLLGDGVNHWSFVHVDDLGELFVRVLERGRDGEEYFAADE